MKTTDGFTDARALLDGYDRRVCPEEGAERWFKYLDRDHCPVAQWNCQTCGSYLCEVLEYPCPECGTRMTYEGDCFTCQACSDCGGFHDVEIDRETLIDRLTGEHTTAAGYQHSEFQECPVCGERSILNGPDGERQCDECGKFYAGRFSASWFCYAIWLRDPETIRVTVEP